MEAADSLKKRYGYKLIANLAGLVISLGTQAIIPRGLGPKAYGDFNFITNFFTQVVSFLDMGTSIGFYTKLSQRPKESGLVSFYLSFSFVISIILALFVATAGMFSAHTSLWPGQEMLYVSLGAVWGMFYWAALVLNKMGDAYGITVSVEIIRILQKILGLVLIALLFFSHRLDLTAFFYYQLVLFGVLIYAFVRIMRRKGFPLPRNWRLSKDQVKGYSREFYTYSHPLFSYALIGLIVGILDRWLLQNYAGSVQQGFYSLSFQIGALCFLFTSAMTPLLTREFTLAFGSHDLARMAELFRRYIPLLYTTAAYFSCFIALQAERVVYIMGGNNYSGALLPVIIMAFYPVHQTYGQLSGAVFFATEQTALYRNIGILFMTLGLPVTYFLIAPTRHMGLNTGATGLAIKMVLIQFLAVNVQLYFNAKLLNLSFGRYLAHQVLSVASLLVIAALASFAVNHMPVLRGREITGFIASGIIYTILVVGLVYCLPVLFGLQRGDIRMFQKYVQHKFAPSR